MLGKLSNSVGSTRPNVLLIIAILVIAVGGILIGAWSYFTNQQIDAAKRDLAEFQDPLPAGFKFIDGLEAAYADAGGPCLTALHEPTGMTIHLSKIYKGPQDSDQEYVGWIKENQHIDSSEICSKGNLDVAGQNMRYFVFAKAGRGRLIGFLPSARDTVAAESKQRDFDMPVLTQFLAAVHVLKH